MALGTISGCVNHPGVEAVARCKQCNKPVCSACRVTGPTGTFCSDACKAKHENFVQRAAQLDSMRRPSKLMSNLKRLVGKLIVILILAVFLGVLGTFVDVPVLSPLVQSVRNMIGI